MHPTPATWRPVRCAKGQSMDRGVWLLSPLRHGPARSEPDTLPRAAASGTAPSLSHPPPTPLDALMGGALPPAAARTSASSSSAARPTKWLSRDAPSITCRRANQKSRPRHPCSPTRPAGQQPPPGSSGQKWHQREESDVRSLSQRPQLVFHGAPFRARPGPGRNPSQAPG